MVAEAHGSRPQVEKRSGDCLGCADDVRTRARLLQQPDAHVRTASAHLVRALCPEYATRCGHLQALSLWRMEMMHALLALLTVFWQVFASHSYIWLCAIVTSTARSNGAVVATASSQMKR